MKYLPNTPMIGLAAAVALGIAGLDTGQTALAQSVPADLMGAKSGTMAKIGTDLAGLYQQQSAFALRVAPSTAVAGVTADQSMMQIVGDKVVIDAVAAGDTDALLRELEALGLENGSSFGHVVSGLLPISALEAAAGLDTLQFARPAMAMTNIGSVTSQGDRAMFADEARDEEGVRGRRVTIGVMSDSYDCLGGAAADIASRDLPRASRINILEEGPCPASDEGRGMMQLIRDVAPASRQAFHTAFGGQADFALGILELADPALGNADIVVDDVIYFAEPMFQDGIIAQAADTVKANGVAYFSSAGNGGRNSWETDAQGFESAGTVGFFGGIRHDFDPGEGVDDLQSFVLASGTTIWSFQWDEPFASVSGAPGSASDLDILLYDSTGAFTLLGGFSFNEGGDPVEVFGVINNGPEVIFQIGIELFSGPEPNFMKYVVFDPSGPAITDPPTSFPVDFPTDSATNYGHSNAAGAAGVGAAFWRNTPAFGVSPPEPEVFSSAGGTPIFFDTAGNRIPTEVRLKPNFSGPDGGVTTFFGGRDSFGDRTPGGNHFFGTSASAPHVAAVAALMLEANRALQPDDIYEILEDTAIDMDDPFTPGFDRGFDFGTGHGFVDAEEAVEEAEDFEADDDDDDGDEFAFAE